jgi:hypothetical protein
MEENNELKNRLHLTHVICPILKTMMTSKYYLIILFNLIIASSFGQSKSEIETMALKPRKYLNFSTYYNMILPSMDFEKWDFDYNYFLKSLNPRNKNSINMFDNLDKLHVRLDTITSIKNLNQIIGIWRSVLDRSFQVRDSISYDTKVVYRDDRIINVNELDDAFTIFTEKRYIEYFKKKNKETFNERNFKYQIIDGRYLDFSKDLGLSRGIYVIGIDKNGYLILEYASVIERKQYGKYKTYISYIEQMIFEKAE